MLERVERSQLNWIIGGLAILVVVAFVAGSFFGGGLADEFRNDESPTGGDIEIGEEVSEDEIKQNAQSFMDLQLAQTRRQLEMIVDQSENISEDDVYIDASIDDVSSSEFGSLYNVTVSITGTMPSQTGGLEDIDQEQSLFISEDGRYVFQEPIDLEQDLGQSQQ